MFNLGMGEIVMIVLLLLIVVGPKKLPQMAAGLGKAIREVRKATSDIKNEIELDENIRKPLEELRDAATLPAEELKRLDRVRREHEKALAEDIATVLDADAQPADQRVDEGITAARDTAGTDTTVGTGTTGTGATVGTGTTVGTSTPAGTSTNSILPPPAAGLPGAPPSGTSARSVAGTAARPADAIRLPPPGGKATR